MTAHTPSFHHTFRLETTEGNVCVQPVIAEMESSGFLRWHSVPANWTRPPSKRDFAEWSAWLEDGCLDAARELANEFRAKHWRERMP
jgi:hypothetical protein